MSKNLTSSDWWIAADDEEGQGQGYTGGQTSGQWATLKYMPASGGRSAFTRFRLFSYNPNRKGRGKTVLYPQVKSVKAFKGLRGRSVNFEARMSFGPARPKGGIVCGFYPFNQDHYNPIYGQNEIDMEFLHNQMPLGKIWTNIYEDYDQRWTEDDPNVSQRRLDAFYRYKDPFYLKSAGSTNWAIPRTYKITWSSDATYWYVNDAQLNAQRRGAEKEGIYVPLANYNKPLQVHMNMWSPHRVNDLSWKQAVDPKFIPATKPSYSQSWYYDVEYVKVTNSAQVEGKLKTRKRGNG